MNGAVFSSNWMPAAVSRTRLPTGSVSFRPSALSSASMRLLTADCEMRSRVPAFVMVPVSESAARVSMFSIICQRPRYGVPVIRPPRQAAHPLSLQLQPIPFGNIIYNNDSLLYGIEFS